MSYQPKVTDLDSSFLVQYTEVYAHVYACLQKDEVSHEVTHHTAIAITEALCNYQLTVYKKTDSVVAANATIDSVLGLGFF